MPRQPVEVVRTQGAEQSEGLDIKRFYVPGCKITSKCPKCGATVEKDLGQHYLSYPSLDKPTEVDFYCDDDRGGCDNEWTGLVQVSIEIKAVAPGPALPEPAPKPAPEAVHRCDWASQPDLHIACGKPWAVPAWKTATTDPHTPTEGVYRTDDGRLYTFDAHKVTCETCKAAPPYVSPEPEQTGVRSRQ